MDISLCLAAAMDGGYECIIFVPWAIVIVLGLIGLLMVGEKKYSVAITLGFLPLFLGILPLPWVFSTPLEKWDVWIAVIAGVPLGLGVLTFWLGISGFNKDPNPESEESEEKDD